jgi:hypothetical protein
MRRFDGTKLARRSSRASEGSVAAEQQCDYSIFLFYILILYFIYPPKS